MRGEGPPESLADRVLDLERLFREGGASQLTDHVERVTGRPVRRFADYLAEVAPRLAAA